MLFKLFTLLNTALLIYLISKESTLMATLEDLVAAAEAEDTKIDSLIALVEKLHEQLGQIPGLTPLQQAAIDRAFAAISDNPDRIQAAIDANTGEGELPNA